MEAVISAAGKTDELFSKITEYVVKPQFWISIAIVVFAIFLWQIIKKAHKKYNKENKNANSTAAHVIFDIIRVVFVFVVVVILLQMNGLNVSSLIAGLSIVSVIVAFALQDYLKDIIMGTHILTDKFFEVGDVVRYNGIEGTVISFNLRTTKLKNVQYNEIITISNRNISEIQVLGDMFDFDINIPYEEDPKLVHTTLREASQRIKQLNGVKDCIYKGTQDFADSAIVYRIRYFTDPGGKRFEVRRAIADMIQTTMLEHGIPFAYNHLDVQLVETKKKNL